MALLLAGLMLSSVAAAQEVSPPLPTAPASPSEKIEMPRSRAREDFIALNFTNIEIGALVKVMSELTRKNFILDERVVGKVTLMTPTRISPDEAYQVFQSALEIKGFTAIEDGKIVRIIPSAQARQSGLKVFQDGRFGGEGYVTQLIRMAYVNPQEITRALTPLMSKDGSLIAYAPTNSLIITDSVSNIRKIESLVHAMDVAATEGKGKINVYYLKHANAEDIAKGMAALVARLPVPPAGGAVAGPQSILEGTVTISSDKATNSLIIVASPGDYETVKDVILKLDIRRRQVYVEAAIIEMSLQKQRELGFEFQVPVDQGRFDAGRTVGVGGTNFGNIAAVAAGPAGFATLSGLNVGAIRGTFKFNGQEFLNIGALLHALQTNGDVNVLSTPNILTTDNQKAEIMVGQNVPFTTGQTQNATTGSQAIFNTIERKDVGIKLAITPQISSDDTVRLDINQEISDVVPSSAQNSGGFITNKRSATTTVVVKDRETMVIGGLIRDNVTSSESKVPFLGDIPLLGWFFKFNSTKVEKTNLMIFITPYIIKNEQDANDITNRKSESLENFRKEYHIEKKGIEPFSIPKSSEKSTGPAPLAPHAEAATAPTVTAPAPAVTVTAPTATTPVPESSAIPAKDQR
jgi:general secretion pathway protein D